MDTPFIDRMQTLANLPTRFFVPGHKGRLPLFGEMPRYDMTEIKGADDVSHPSGPLLLSEQNMARAFGAGATLYSAAGCSSCICAMLTLFVKPGGPVIMARNCHTSAVRALAFLDARPLWLVPEEGAVSPRQVADALERHPGAPVYLTSPDYYGRMADIASIARVCRTAGAPLLVDNAHGAHLRFACPDRHPLTLGANATADSAHKTLPCLTPAALLHLRDGALKPAARRALNLYSSTSPAYPVLMSLDYAAGLLGETPPDFPAAAAQVAGIRNEFSPLVQPCDDPLRLRLVPPLGGYPAPVLAEALEKAGLLPEFYDGETIILMATPYNTSSDFQTLEEILRNFPPKAPLPTRTLSLSLPEAVLPVRQALFAPAQPLPTRQAAGRIAACIEAPCPPGVPLVMPGERITPQTASALSAGGILEMDVVK